MTCRIIASTALFVLVTVSAASADGVDVTVPDRYVTADTSRVGTTGTVRRIWRRTIDGKPHVIVASSLPFLGELEGAGDVMKTYVTARGGGVAAREAAAPLCGAPSNRFTVTYPQKWVEVFRSVSVAGRALYVIYAHPDGAPADPAALAALDTLCSGVHQPAAPAGWTTEPSTANTSVFKAGGGTSTFSSIAVPDDRTAPSVPDETALSLDRDEPCGFVMIRHRVVPGDVTTTEMVTGLVRGYRYLNTYTRPRGTPADAGATTALRSFCAETSTTAAPAPRPSPGVP